VGSAIAVVFPAVIGSAIAVWETVQSIVERLVVLTGAVHRAVSAAARQASGAVVVTAEEVVRVVALVVGAAAVAVEVAVVVVVVADSNSPKGESDVLVELRSSQKVQTVYEFTRPVMLVVNRGLDACGSANNKRRARKWFRDCTGCSCCSRGRSREV
jgi:hypothetical protein